MSVRGRPNGKRRTGSTESFNHSWSSAKRWKMAEDRLGVLRGAEATVGAELIGGGPEALFQRLGGAIFFSLGDPVHGSLAYGEMICWWRVIASEGKHGEGETGAPKRS